MVEPFNWKWPLKPYELSGNCVSVCSSPLDVKLSLIALLNIYMYIPALLCI